MNTQSNSTHSDWLRIAEVVHDNYKKMDKYSVDKTKLLIVLEVFNDLYHARINQQEDFSYISNLRQPRSLEGRKEDVIGSVSGGVERTRRLINCPDPISGRQASIVARNLVAILSREQFSSDIAVLLAPHFEVLKDLAGGQM